jgi:transposase-like protein
VSMTNSSDRVEIITPVQRRRRWTAPEKVRMVEETFEPGMTVRLVARRHGVAPKQLFTWRRLVAQGSLTAAGSGEEVVPASDYRALQNQVRELPANSGSFFFPRTPIQHGRDRQWSPRVAGVVPVAGRRSSRLHYPPPSTVPRANDASLIWGIPTARRIY